MFTGLVECCLPIAAVQDEGPGRKITLETPGWGKEVEMGASIAINGCCLTVIAIEGDQLSFEAGPETLSRTNLGKLKPGDRVNLERSLKVGDPLGGHWVTGHVDALGSLLERLEDGQWATLWFSLPSYLNKQLASKGSIAIDGVSLTLVDVEPERFSVALIPHTLEVTTLGKLALGDEVNLETDLMAKYVEKQMTAARII
ncbi:Riboflavin synthase subunit alpha [Planctomycetales bacterium 10988]|nr:Riboflavin synthase subunit alpha [Planctomycetales bacterium 10988]